MAAVARLARSAGKGAARETVREFRIERSGVAGDARSGGSRSVSLLSEAIRSELDSRDSNGLCERRFFEDITVRGRIGESELRDVPAGTRVRAGTAELRFSGEGKRCHAECPLTVAGAACTLSREARFAEVTVAGTVRVGDAIEIEPGPPR